MTSDLSDVGRTRLTSHLTRCERFERASFERESFERTIFSACHFSDMTLEQASVGL